MHFSDWLMFHAVATPPAPAIVTPKARLTYGQLYGAVRAAANRLHKSGIKAGSTAAIWVTNPALHTVMVCALNRLGAVSVPLLHIEPGRTTVPAGVSVDFVIADGEGRFAFCSNTVAVDISWLKDWENTEPMPEGGFARESDVCLITTSSGTTGEPKAIGLTLANISCRLRQQTIGPIASGYEQKTMGLLDLSTIWGLLTVFQSLWSGGTYFSNFSQRTGHVIADFRIDRVIGSVASVGQLVDMVEADPVDCTSLKLVGVGGAMLPQSFANRIAQTLCKNIVNMYGSAEIGYAASAPITRLRNIPGGVGVIAPWVDAEAVDQDGNKLPPGVVGELRFRSEGLVKGYMYAPAANAKSFRDGWFYPGDLGAVTQNRILLLAGRVDNVINAGGRKINPHSIEDALTALDEVNEAAAFIASVGNGADKIWVAVEPRRGADASDLKTLCRQQLKDGPVDYLIVLEKLPRNAMGKVSRRELRKLAETMKQSALKLRAN